MGLLLTEWDMDTDYDSSAGGGWGGGLSPPYCY